MLAPTTRDAWIHRSGVKASSRAKLLINATAERLPELTADLKLIVEGEPAQHRLDPPDEVNNPTSRFSRQLMNPT